MNQPVKPLLLAVPINHVDHITGPDSAKVTLVEYGDFECPSCAQAYPAVKIMLKHFGDRLRFVFRHYPLREVHKHAEAAAEAAEAAAGQHKFWHMYNLMFENQLHLKDNNLRKYAEDLELDLVRFDYEMKDHVYLQRVQEHIAGGKQSALRSTPAFFVNGVGVDVSFGFDHLQAAIETALRG